MNHKYIDELDLVERYLMQRLGAEEAAEFEEHFVDCLECVGQLKTTKALIDGLRIVASEPAPDPLRYEPRGSLGWWRPTGSRRSLALAAGVLLLVALAGALIVSSQNRRWRVEVDQARSASAEWQRRYEGEQESSSLAEMKHQESERNLKTELAQLRTELENEPKVNTKEMVDDYGALKKPQINIPILVLTSPRRSETATGALNELILPRSPANFVISVPLEGEPSYKTYGMTILGDHGRPILKEGGFKPDHDKALSALVNSTFFRAGDYLLSVEGVGEDGSMTVVGKYSFRVVKTL